MYKFQYKRKNCTQALSKLQFGHFGLSAQENVEFNTNQLLSIKKTLSFFFKKKIKIWFIVPPATNKTHKAVGVRMGSGKGPIKHTIIKLRKGQIFMEWSIVSLNFSYLLLKKIIAKLSFKTSTIYRGL